MISQSFEDHFVFLSTKTSIFYVPKVFHYKCSQVLFIFVLVFVCLLVCFVLFSPLFFYFLKNFNISIVWKRTLEFWQGQKLCGWRHAFPFSHETPLHAGWVMSCVRSPFPISHFCFSGKCWQQVRIITQHESYEKLGPQCCLHKNSKERNSLGFVGQVEMVSHLLQSPTGSGCSKSCQPKQCISAMILNQGKDGSTFGPNIISGLCIQAAESIS